MIVLFVKARLENISRFSLPQGYTYTLKVSALLSVGSLARMKTHTVCKTDLLPYLR